MWPGLHIPMAAVKTAKCEPVNFWPGSHLGESGEDTRREIMAFSDFPFLPATMGRLSRDDRRFPGHTEVPLPPSLRCCVGLKAPCFLHGRTMSARGSRGRVAACVSRRTGWCV